MIWNDLEAMTLIKPSATTRTPPTVAWLESNESFIHTVLVLVLGFMTRYD